MSDNFQNDDLPWLKGDDQASNTAGPEKSGVTGQLPWRSELGPNPDATDDDGLAAVQWGASGAGSSAGQSPDPTKGFTGALPWNAQASDPADKPSSEEMLTWLDNEEVGEVPSPTPQSAPAMAESPDWLLEMDEPDFEPAQEAEPPQASASDAPDWLMGWEDSTPPAPVAPPTQPAPTMAETPDWLLDMDASDLDASSPGDDVDALFQMPDELAPQADVDDLFQFPEETFAQDESPAQMPNWLGAVAEESPVQAEMPSDDSDLPDWLRGTGDSFGESAAPAVNEAPQWVEEAAPAEAEESFPDWMSSDGSEFATGALPKAPPPVSNDLNWLDQYDEQVGDSAQAEAEPQSYDDWLRQTQGGQAEEELAQEDDALNWMSLPGAEAPAQDMTYADWERQQREAEEAARDDIIPAPDEVIPDWFLGETGNLPSMTGALSSQSADYVPEWFMGVEELDDSDAPEWARATSGAFKPPSAPLTPPPDLLADIPLPDLPLGEPEMASAPLGLDDLLGDLSEDDLFASPPAGIQPMAAVPSGAANAPLDLGDLLLDEPEFDGGLDDFDAMFAAVDSPPAAEPPRLSPSVGRTEALEKLFPVRDSEVEPTPGFDDLFGDLVMPSATGPLPTPATGDLDLPDFMDMEAFPGFADESVVADFPPDEGEPAWLQEFDSSAGAEAPVGMDWLGAPAELELPSEPLPSAELDSLPDWMSELQDLPTPEAALPPLDFDNFVLEEPPAPASSAPAQDIYDLDSILGAPPDDLPSYSPPSSPTGYESMGDDLLFDDSFLGDYRPSQAADLPAIDLGDPLLADDEPALVQEALPDWMRQIKASGDQVAVRLGGVEGYFEQIPDAALPTDLRELRLATQAWTATPPSAARPLAEGPLAGVEGALPLALPLISPAALLLNKAYHPTPEQLTRQAILERLFEEVQAERQANQGDLKYGLEGEDVVALEEDLKAAPKARTRLKRQPQRWAVTALLLVAVLLPFLLEAFQVAEEPPAELSPSGLALAQQIDQLRTRQRVLVAFEYGSTAAAELDPLAEAVLRDIVTQGGMPVVVSTNPMGSLHAQSIALGFAQDTTLREALYPLKPFVRVMPYLPGGPVGVRALVASETTSATYFSRDVNGASTGLEIEGLGVGDFALVIVIGESAEDTRIWAEQLADLPLPKFALVTASAATMTRPYQEAGLYTGLLSGQRDGLIYDQVRNNDTRDAITLSDQLPNPDNANWHSSVFGALIAALVVILGAVLNMIGAIWQRRKSKR